MCTACAVSWTIIEQFELSCASDLIMNEFIIFGIVYILELQLINILHFALFLLCTANAAQHLGHLGTNKVLSNVMLS